MLCAAEEVDEEDEEKKNTCNYTLAPLMIDPIGGAWTRGIDYLHV